MTHRLEIRGVHKHFQGVHALKGVTLRLAAGSVLGLVGENGAGKSTLMNVLGGVVTPDAGDMLLDGAPYAPASAAEAERAGIAFIHQELNLFPSLSIADNLFISGYPSLGRLPLIGWRKTRARARELLAQVGLDVSPDLLVEKLSPGERQLVEIAKALRTDARLIIFDEPTTSLTSRETDRLFRLMEHLRDHGTSIVFISHDLADVRALADEIVVLRDGEVVAAGAAEELTVERMIGCMIGRSLEQLFPPRTGAPREEPTLEVRGVTQPGTLHRIGFTLRRGEILGLFGLMGSGRTELARVLFGLDPMSEGEILLEGRPCHALPPHRRIERGMAFVTEDRRGEGLLMEVPVIDNLGLASLAKFASAARMLDEPRLRARALELVEAVRLRAESPDRQPVKNLSGGNQQKVVLGKWLLTEPRVLIMDEPTRGIDVGTRYEVYLLIHALAEDGVGVLSISSDVEELVGLCDRILVMSRGELTGSFDRGAFDTERILRAAFGERTEEARHRARHRGGDPGSPRGILEPKF